MILRNIKLSNIRSYVSQGIDFPDGSLLFSGDIGAGKSTILLAIEFALFGIMRGDISGENLLRHGSKEGSVELRFEVDDHEVLVKRNLKAAKDGVKQESGFVVVDGKKVEATPVELKTRIIELLGYPKELVSKSKSLVYRYTVYTPQEQMKQILFEDREQRLDILRRVFGIDKYKRISENSQILLRAMKEKSKELEGRVFGIDDKKKQLAQNRNEIDKLKESLEKTRIGVASAKKIVEEKSSAIREVEKNVDILKDLRRELELSNIRLNEKASLAQKNAKEEQALKTDIEELKKRISAAAIKEAPPLKDIEMSIREKDLKIKSVLEQRSELSERAKHLGLRLKELKKSMDNMSEQCSKHKAKEAELSALHKNITEKDSIKKQIKVIEDDIAGLNRKMAEAESAKKSSESMAKKISSLENCPTCLQPVGKEHKKRIIDVEDEKARQSKAFMGQIEKEMAEKSSALKKLQKSIEEIFEHEKAAEKIKAEMKTIEKTKESLAESMAEKASKEAELVAAEKRLDELKKEDVSRLAKELDDERLLLKRLEERAHLSDMLDEKSRRADELRMMHEEIKRDIGDINKSKIEINESIKKMGDAEDRYIKAKKDLDDARDSQKRREIEEKGFLTQAESISRIIKNLDDEIEQKLAARKNLERISQLQGWVENSFLNIMNVIEKSVMYKIQAQFSELFQKWFRSLVEDDALSIGIDESFTPVVEQDGYEASIDGLSGGEKTAVALAYRLSLNRVINDIVGSIKTKDLIILDEPTDGFSSEQLDRVKEVIDELNMRQVMLVSHEPKVEGFVGNVIRIEKSGHVSSVI